ncbi:MAG: tRNA (guanosine(37)-N1)-methyltransferase TrmD, partial [Erysipelotrichaceae bacterium]|nr:tRNA (guanosine(37)-N1)-methyltransferase TrmD [Erysipelotrichaceae bacterium]
MKITVLTLFPEMYEGFLNASIIKRILAKGLAEIKIVNIRDYSMDKHHHVDDTPYGGGAGMLMKVDVVHRALLDNISNDYTYA